MADKRQQDLNHLREITEFPEKIIVDSYDSNGQDLHKTANTLLGLSQNSSDQDVDAGEESKQENNIKIIQVENPQAERKEESAAENGNQGQDWKGLADWCRDKRNSPQKEPLQEESNHKGLTTCGLVNFGNNCYFNSSIQVLFHIPEFTEIIMSVFPQPVMSVKNGCNTKILQKSQVVTNTQAQEAQLQNTLPASEAIISNTTGEDSTTEGVKKEDQQDDTFKSKFRLLESLQILFTKMIKSSMPFQNAKEVLDIVWDAKNDQNNRKGDQMDSTEFCYELLNQLLESFKPLENNLGSNEDRKGQNDNSCGDFKKKATSFLSCLISKQTKVETNSLSDPLDKFDDKIITEINQSLAAAKERLQSLFYGEWKPSIFHGDNNEYCSEIDPEKFASIPLLPKYGDLYSAWDATFNEEISKYTPNGTDEEVKALKKYAITKLPKVLVFTINRAEIDKNGNQCKNNCRFDFDDVIYPEKYLETSIEQIKAIEGRMKGYFERAQFLQIKISNFTGEYSEQNPIIPILTRCTELLQSSTTPNNSINPYPDINVYYPEDTFKNRETPLTSEKADEIINYFMIAKEKIKWQITHMQSQLTEILKEIKRAYREIDATPYYLHSMIIHNGGTKFGHYYAFVKDHDSNVYYKLNDEDVRVMDSSNAKEEVERSSKGGSGAESASCLVYVNQGIHDRLVQSSLNSNAPGVNELFNSLVPQEVAESIIQNEKSQAEKSASKIIDLYNRRRKIVDNFHQNCGSLNESLSLSIFSSFRNKDKGDDPDYSHLAKWLLFNQCYQEITNKDGYQVPLERMSPLRKKLEELISSDKDYFPNSLTLIKNERDKILQTVENYKESTITANIEYKVCQDILNHRPDLAFQKIIKRLHELKDVTQMACLYRLGEICMLKTTMMINRAIITKESFEEVIEPLLFSLIQAFHTVYTNKNSLFYKQVIDNLDATLIIAKAKLECNAEKFGNILGVLEAKRFDMVKISQILLPQYGKDLETTITSVQNTNFITEWDASFLTDNIQFMLKKLLDELKIKESVLYEIHRRLIKGEEGVLLPEDYLEMEKKCGIDLVKFCE
ncbi:unnamed protein product [Moneuplotes crassus]|uniref:USP domain-containing protein n=1 Tax=Euplotes crassus TaxID=5936 RepID=A0AAD2CYS7_EUPCR|nr:unnamed protein product [Moneuplotes crassus]